MDTITDDITHIVRLISENPELIAKITAEGYKLYATRAAAETAFNKTDTSTIVYFADLLMYGVGPEGQSWVGPGGKPWGVLDARGFEYHIYGMNHDNDIGCSMPDCVGCRCGFVLARHSVADYCRHYADDNDAEDDLERFFAFTGLVNNALKDPTFAKVYASVNDTISQLRKDKEACDDLKQWLAELNSSMFVYDCDTTNKGRLILVVFAANAERAADIAITKGKNPKLLFTLLDANFRRGYRDLVWKTIVRGDIQNSELTFCSGAGVWSGWMSDESVETLLARCGMHGGNGR